MPDQEPGEFIHLLVTSSHQYFLVQPLKMEKAKQLLESAAENYMVAAENICKYIEDPKEREKHLDDLRALALEHANASLKLDSQSKALIQVAEQLKEIKDLEVEKQYEMMLKRYLNGNKKSDEEIQNDDKNCQELEETIKKSMNAIVKSE